MNLCRTIYYDDRIRGRTCLRSPRLLQRRRRGGEPSLYTAAGTALSTLPTGLRQTRLVSKFVGFFVLHIQTSMLDCMQNGRTGPVGSAKAEAPVLYILSGNMIWCVSMQEDKPGTGKARALYTRRIVVLVLWFRATALLA